MLARADAILRAAAGQAATWLVRRTGQHSFDSGRLAQLGEHHVRNVGVVGSNPMPSTSPQPID